MLKITKREQSLKIYERGSLNANRPWEISKCPKSHRNLYIYTRDESNLSKIVTKIYNLVEN